MGAIAETAANYAAALMDLERAIARASSLVEVSDLLNGFSRKHGNHEQYRRDVIDSLIYRLPAFGEDVRSYKSFDEDPRDHADSCKGGFWSWDDESYLYLETGAEDGGVEFKLTDRSDWEF